MGLALLMVVKLTLRPAISFRPTISFGLPLIKGGGVSLSTEREGVSGTSPFGESDDDLSWSLSKGSDPPPIGREVPSLLPSGDVFGLSSESIDLSSDFSPDRGEAPTH